MNTPWKYWLCNVCADAGLVILAWLWYAQGSASAESVFVVVCWVLTICGFINFGAWLVLPIGSVRLYPRPRGFTTYHWATTIALVVFLAASGYIWLPVLCLFSALFHEASVRGSKKVA